MQRGVTPRYFKHIGLSKEDLNQKGGRNSRNVTLIATIANHTVKPCYTRLGAGLRKRL